MAVLDSPATFDFGKMDGSAIDAYRRSWGRRASRRARGPSSPARAVVGGMTVWP